jgi:ABC-type Fe3+/spermidine/putrescine transport system ATPase subunit
LVLVDGVGVIRAVGSAESGTRVLLAIRPEKIMLANGHKQGKNTVSGTVVTLVFRGSDTQIIVRLGNGKEFTVELPNQTSFQPDQLLPGSTIDLAWDPASTALLTS